ncbi:MAG: hypothetical protein ACMXYG_03365 [Candidatus Woesearchaeota archaeon]
MPKLNQKQAKKQKTNNASNSLKSCFSKINYWYVFYILVIGIFIFNTSVQVVHGGLELSPGTFCYKICFCDACKGSRPDSPAEDEGAEDIEEGPEEPIPCNEQKSVSSSVSGGIFSYTFIYSPCDPTSLSVYLERDSSASFVPDPDNVVPTGPMYLYSGRGMDKGDIVGGSGEYPETENFIRVCIQYGATTECS